ncbi:hypothetical protein Pcinc_023882 [Petrolisthes cinctipes]|uniref:Uncharacterized protein n=1 Tax=Petrolisthes cinctipes TaxID=88211 RepID=A0AAE1KF72_PETCI|nr:hypothetical protein Pcinc_023882 [Petrolisthes cinctipes]
MADLGGHYGRLNEVGGMADRTGWVVWGLMGGDLKTIERIGWSGLDNTIAAECAGLMRKEGWRVGRREGEKGKTASQPQGAFYERESEVLESDERPD